MDRIDLARQFDISYDLIDFLCGEFIGEGNSRIVFECNIKPGWVVKIEKEKDSHDNLLEYYMWKSVMYQPEKHKWLADCGTISQNGRILLQKKAKKITDKNKKDIPEKIPTFLTDVKF